MTKSSFVCSTCLEPVRNSWEQIERRIEYRRKSDNGRYRVLMDKMLCIRCADAEVAEVREGNGGEQAPLF